LRTTLAAVAALVVAVTLLASYLPVHRASRVDLMDDAGPSSDRKGVSPIPRLSLDGLRFRVLLQSSSLNVVDDGKPLMDVAQTATVPCWIEFDDSGPLAFAGLDAAAQNRDRSVMRVSLFP
jgi:hypothetical protein